MAVFGVSPNGERWQVTREGEVVSVHPGRAEALAEAEASAKAEDGKLYVVDEAADTTAVQVHGSGEAEGRQGTDVPEPNEAR